MSKIIIFEGTDHCGKTTIAQEFVKRNPGYKYFKVKQEQIHVEKLDHDVLAQAHLLQLNFFYEFARQTGVNVVMDRFYPSEYVYGFLFRNIDEKKILAFDKLFATLDTTIIILEKDDVSLTDRLWSKKQLIAIKERYNTFFTTSACRTLLLNTDSEDIEWELDTINMFLNNVLLKKYYARKEQYNRS